jgi:hypothetical protein
VSAVALVSAATGAHPPPAPVPAQTVDHDLILVTDRADLATGDTVNGWRVVQDPRLHLGRRMAAKVPKCRPDLYTTADVVVWVDAQVIVKSGRFVEWCCDQLADGLVAASPHPRRTCCRDEAVAGQGPEGRGRFDGQAAVAQADSYLAAGLPRHWGLWWTMVMARRRCETTEVLGTLWLAEQAAWSAHDQVSLPYVAWRLGARPVDMAAWPEGTLSIRPLVE